MKTLWWKNPENNHTYSEGPEGSLLNGRPVFMRPDWVFGEPHATYGPIYPWEGGDCPLPHDTQVRCLFRGRPPYEGLAIWPGLPEQAKASMWKHAPAPGRIDPNRDIVAYQLRLAP